MYSQIPTSVPPEIPNATQSSSSEKRIIPVFRSTRPSSDSYIDYAPKLRGAHLAQCHLLSLHLPTIWQQPLWRATARKVAPELRYLSTQKMISSSLTSVRSRKSMGNHVLDLVLHHLPHRWNHWVEIQEFTQSCLCCHSGCSGDRSYMLKHPIAAHLPRKSRLCGSG